MMTETEYLTFLADGHIRPSIAFVRDTLAPPLMGAEIGVQSGDHAAQILAELDLTMLFLVDWWKPYQMGDIPLDFSAEYERVMARFADNLNVQVQHMESTEAAAVMPDALLDFAYIDACHMRDATARDMEAWWLKVVSGGVLAGHDYCDRWPGVMEATEEFARRQNVELFNKDWDWWMQKP